MIHITAITVRQWFEKTNGNTYHTVEFSLDNGTTRKSPKAYGYGNCWRATAHSLIEREEGLSHHVEVFRDATVLEVKRKKDL